MMVMGISALTAERYSNYDAESRFGRDGRRRALSVMKHGARLVLEFSIQLAA